MVGEILIFSSIQFFVSSPFCRLFSVLSQICSPLMFLILIYSPISFQQVTKGLENVFFLHSFILPKPKGWILENVFLLHSFILPKPKVWILFVAALTFLCRFEHCFKTTRLHEGDIKYIVYSNSLCRPSISHIHPIFQVVT